VWNSNQKLERTPNKSHSLVLVIFWPPRPPSLASIGGSEPDLRRDEARGSEEGRSRFPQPGSPKFRPHHQNGQLFTLIFKYFDNAFSAIRGALGGKSHSPVFLELTKTRGKKSALRGQPGVLYSQSPARFNPLDNYPICASSHKPCFPPKIHHIQPTYERSERLGLVFKAVVSRSEFNLFLSLFISFYFNC
jgi:hypothetical protein